MRCVREGKYEEKKRDKRGEKKRSPICVKDSLHIPLEAAYFLFWQREEKEGKDN